MCRWNNINTHRVSRLKSTNNGDGKYEERRFSWPPPSPHDHPDHPSLTKPPPATPAHTTTRYLFEWKTKLQPLPNLTWTNYHYHTLFCIYNIIIDTLYCFFKLGNLYTTHLSCTLTRTIKAFKILYIPHSIFDRDYPTFFNV